MAHAFSMECHHHHRRLLLLRSPARRSSPPQQAHADERLHHRFLRPGALARLRDSKVIARSLRSAAAMAVPSSPARLLPPSSPPPSAQPASAAGDGGGVPHFLGAVRGLRYPLRKKLAAARSVVFLPPPPTDTAEVFMDAFAAAPSELLAAH
ncbi:hypothetical protein E2562_015515 [Oryza meyeriana var. granulata]|uniref:Uncharacterized protein n=1 Tax=Oryza meyeriana var. granulata TaxID=110450 RepID=A0A6G1CQD8_9ORYZ|nr:hypothetical protein E2562_015515 [Oryza meyeriana var. granulata]